MYPLLLVLITSLALISFSPDTEDQKVEEATTAAVVGMTMMFVRAEDVEAKAVKMTKAPTS